MTTKEFLDLLLDRQMISPTVAELFQAKSETDPDIVPESILDILTKRHMLSPAQAAEIRLRAFGMQPYEAAGGEDEVLDLAPLEEFGDDDRPSQGSSSVFSQPAPRSEPRPDWSGVGSDRGESYHLAPEDEDDFDSSALSEDDFSGMPAEAPQIVIPPPPPSQEPIIDASAVAPHAITLRMKTAKQKEKEKEKGKRRGKDDERKRAEKRWDSPLLLFGGGSLAVMAAVAGLLWFLLFRESSDAVLKQASDAFDAGAYSQAEQQYAYFIERYSSHPDLSQAKVRLGMTRLWAAVEGGRFPLALQTALRVVDEIEDEPAFNSEGRNEDGFSQAKQELSQLLTKIARGLAEEAEAADDPAAVRERVTQLKTALELCDNDKYVPDRFRLGKELDLIRGTLDRVGKRQLRDADLTAALRKMDDAIAAGDVAAAYQTRQELLDQYPVLEDDAALASRVRQASQAEKDLVKFTAVGQAALTTSPDSPIVAELALAERLGPATGGDAAPATFQVDGALYALRRGDGGLLWRRHVGADATLPVALPGGDLIAVQASSQELIRLNAQTGKLVWRAPLADELTTPAVVGNRILAGGASGKLFVLEADSGQLIGFAPMSQPIRVPPVANDRGDRVFVVGERANVYTLSADDFSCLAVCYLGHDPGAVQAPPIVLGNKVVVVENVGAETAFVRALGLDERGAATRVVASARLKGLVATPLTADGRRFAVVTSRGSASVFEISGADDGSALAAVARRDARDEAHAAQFALLGQGHVWLAGRQLTKLAVLPTENQLAVRSLQRNFDGDAFDAPLAAAGDLVLSLRRAAGRPGAVAAATDAATGSTRWETALAVPLAGPPAVDTAEFRITVGTSAGAALVLDRQAMARRVQDEAIRTPEWPAAARPAAPPLTAALDLGRGRLALGDAGAPAMLLCRPDELRDRLSAIPLASPLACPLAAWRDGVVAATRGGQIFLFDAGDGTQRGAPFQPELVPGREYHWRRPTVVGAGDAAKLVVSDGVDKIYLLDVADSPEPHLTAAATGDVGPAPLTTPLAAVGALVFAGNEAGELVSYATPALARSEPLALGGRASWGPHAAGEGVLLGVEGGELMLVGGDGAIRWRRPLAHGELGGVPLIDGGEATLLHVEGGLEKISLADGKEVAFADVGQAVVAGPTPFGERLIVAAADGALLVVKRP